MLLSDQSDHNGSFGGGLYATLSDSLDRLSFILYSDMIRKNGAFDNCLDCPTKEITTYFLGLSFGAGVLYSLELHRKIKFKIGPLVSYSAVIGDRQATTTNWIETYTAKGIGTGVICNVRYRPLSKLPVCFDIFLNPMYLVNLSGDTDPTGSGSTYLENSVQFSLHLGLSYLFESNRSK